MLIDYRPVVLTPVRTKCLEKFVLKFLNSLLPPNIDPTQFANRKNRSTDDAISTFLHKLLKHFENPGRIVEFCS